MSVRRWDVAWAGAAASGRGRDRTVLVLCNDRISPLIALVTVLPIARHRKRRRVYPTEVLLPAGSAGMAADSLVLCHQVRTLPAERLSAGPGRLLEPGLQQAVTRALRLWLDLE